MKRALLVGIDDYDNVNDLAGCENDARALQPLLSRNEDGTRNLDTRTLTGRVTRAGLLAGVRELLAPGADIALLYFAGHGTAVRDDVAMFTSDGTTSTPGVRFTEVAESINESTIGEVVVILDCCFSGGAGSVALLAGDTAVLRSGVSILTASRADQVSDELNGRGVFSTLLEGALEGGAADVLGNVTMAGLYAYLSESFDAWEQRPTFKTNVDRLHNVRTCRPAVPIATLRRLVEWFPDPAHVYGLDASYEPDKRDSGLEPHPEHEEIFAQLQKLRVNKLVEPVQDEHMYFAAMNGHGCRLTPLGRHYWQLVAKDRL